MAYFKLIRLLIKGPANTTRRELGIHFMSNTCSGTMNIGVLNGESEPLMMLSW